MLGIIDADAIMYDRPVGRGYVYISRNEKHPWYAADNKPTAKQPAHEFHYSDLKFNSTQDNFCYNVLRGKGIMNKKDGLVYKNIVATYSHQRNTDSNPWVKAFTNFIRQNISD